MAHFHLLDQAYDQTHRGRLIAGGQVLPLLRSRAHDGFLALQYDDRYTPLLQMAGLDVISYQVATRDSQLSPPVRRDDSDPTGLSEDAGSVDSGPASHRAVRLRWLESTSRSRPGARG
nr:uncharacterized protein LOC117858655 [Setaria viridis]